MDMLVDVKLEGKLIAIIKVINPNSIAHALAVSRDKVAYEIRETTPDCVVDLTPQEKEQDEPLPALVRNSC